MDQHDIEVNLAQVKWHLAGIEVGLEPGKPDEVQSGLAKVHTAVEKLIEGLCPAPTPVSN
jgi:hypothetical protein